MKIYLKHRDTIFYGKNDFHSVGYSLFIKCAKGVHEGFAVQSALLRSKRCHFDNQNFKTKTTKAIA